MTKIFKNIFAILTAVLFLVLPVATFGAVGDPIDVQVQVPSSAAKADEVVTVTINVKNNSVGTYGGVILNATIGSGLEYQAGSLTQAGSGLPDHNYDVLTSDGLFLGDIKKDEAVAVSMKFKITATTDQGIKATASGSGSPDANGSGTVLITTGPVTPTPNPSPGPGPVTPTPVTHKNCVTDAGSLDNTLTELCNPLPDDSFVKFNVRVIRFVLGAAGGLATLAIMKAGFAMIMADGNEEAITGAKNTITWALVGLVIAILAYSFVAIVETELKSPPGATTTAPAN
jgi:uncharacterized repeat protein (TIGR01451 family)